MHNKALTIDEIDSKIKDLSTIRETIMAASQLSCESTDSMVAKKYIELQSVVDVAEYLNSQGIRISTDGHRKGERRYIPNDITRVITDTNNKGELFRIARMLFYYNKGETKIRALVNMLKSIEIGTKTR